MQLKLLEEAIFEAKRFLKKAEECKKRFKNVRKLEVRKEPA